MSSQSSSGEFASNIVGNCQFQGINYSFRFTYKIKQFGGRPIECIIPEQNGKAWEEVLFVFFTLYY
jgi:hypothetical protein